MPIHDYSSAYDNNPYVSALKKLSEVEQIIAKLDQYTPHKMKLMTTVNVTLTSGSRNTFEY